MTDKQLLKQALEALESVLCDPDGNVCWHGSYADRDIIGDALAVFRTAIEQVEKQEPVGKVNELFDEAVIELFGFDRELLVYTTPPAAQPAPARELEREAFLAGYEDAEADAKVCHMPPDGWRCTRTAGHDGPCAAVESPEDLDFVARGMNRLREATPPAAPVQDDMPKIGCVNHDCDKCKAAAPVQELEKASAMALDAIAASGDFLFNWHDCEPNNEREMDGYSEVLALNEKAFNALRKCLLTPAAQKPFVGLTDEEANELWESTDSDWELMKRTEAKLRERNGG